MPWLRSLPGVLAMGEGRGSGGGEGPSWAVASCFFLQEFSQRSTPAASLAGVVSVLIR